MKKLIARLKEFFQTAGDFIKTYSRDVHNWFVEHISTIKTFFAGMGIGLLIVTLRSYFIRVDVNKFER